MPLMAGCPNECPQQGRVGASPSLPPSYSGSEAGLWGQQEILGPGGLVSRQEFMGLGIMEGRKEEEGAPFLSVSWRWGEVGGPLVVN